MKPKAILSLTIPVIVLILITLCMTKISNVERQLSELRVELQDPCNMSVSTICAPTLPAEADVTNVTRTNNENDQLRVNNQLELVNYSENITHFRICAYQWLDGALTVRETLHCIDDYVKKTNDSIYRDGNHDN